MSRPVDPLDRVYYSAHPEDKTGGSQTPEIEALLIPEVVDALSDVQEASFGALKYNPATAEAQLARLAILKPYLDPSRATRLTRGTTLANGILERGIEKDRNRTSKSHIDDKEPEHDIPFAEQMVRRIAQATERGQKIGHDLEKKVATTYTSDPSLLFEAFAAFGELKQEVGKSSLINQALIDLFANQPFPIRTADPEKFIGFMGQAEVRIKTTQASDILQPILEEAPMHSEPVKEPAVNGIDPGSLETAIIWAQFIKHLSSANNPAQALAIANEICERALEYGMQEGAANLLSLFTATYAHGHESSKKILGNFGITLPPKMFNPNEYYRFAYLVVGSIAHCNAKTDAFADAGEINYGVTGRTGMNFESLNRVIRQSDRSNGTRFQDLLANKYHRSLLKATDDILREQLDPRDTIWSHKAQELRYSYHRSAKPEEMVLSPIDAFSVPKFISQSANSVNPLDRIRDDYITATTEHFLSHRGYFNTIAKLLPLDIQPEQYPLLRKEIEDIKTDIFVNGEYFISPKGDRFIIDDPELVEAGLEHITFSKQPSDKRSTHVVLRFGNANISCVISPDMDLFTDDGEPLTLQEDSTEPLEYLIFAHLQALKCQPEAITETFTPQIPEIDTNNESFVRRAHMRKLPDGHQPSIRQIELAEAYEDFDLVDDNAYRERRGLQIRTYVEATIVDPENLEPNSLKARTVTKKLKQLTNQPTSV